MGRKRDPAGELPRQMSGVSKSEFDPKRGLEYGAYRLGQMQTAAKRESLTGFTDDYNAGPSTLRNAFRAAKQRQVQNR